MFYIVLFLLLNQPFTTLVRPSPLSYGMDPPTPAFHAPPRQQALHGVEPGDANAGWVDVSQSQAERVTWKEWNSPVPIRLCVKDFKLAPEQGRFQVQRI